MPLYDFNYLEYMFRRCTRPARCHKALAQGAVSLHAQTRVWLNMAGIEIGIPSRQCLYLHIASPEQSLMHPGPCQSELDMQWNFASSLSKYPHLVRASAQRRTPTSLRRGWSSCARHQCPAPPPVTDASFAHRPCATVAESAPEAGIPAAQIQTAGHARIS